jgi:hypothetical protein
MIGPRHELRNADMLRERGAAKACPDHMLLRGDRGGATCLGVRTSSGHIRLSGPTPLPLSQLRRHAQLALVERRIHLHVICLRSPYRSARQVPARRLANVGPEQDPCIQIWIAIGPSAIRGTSIHRDQLVDPATLMVNPL